MTSRTHERPCAKELVSSVVYQRPVGHGLKKEENIIWFKKLEKITSEIKALKGQYGIGFVLGSGNIWRGATNVKMGINRLDADSIGMLDTIMNTISLNTSLNKNGMNAKAYLALNVPR